ncbi:questin oxidase family protein [Nocardia alni]|uniref:questin oxidase family protein n=1 Tax=Nocardia alni TaxID=2815723 RepID=UPI001C2484BA|nr:questin oxidase family protein [Nocardia alni]
MSSTLDETLERMRGASPEHANGVPNHGPMAAEALVALGCEGEQVLRWVDRYRTTLVPMPGSTLRITDHSWPEALGRMDAIADWAAFFGNELADHPWESVLERWLPRLLPGLMAAGTHGFIRTAHAIRALGDAPTPLRLEELGLALGFWAAYYQKLPGEPVLVGDLGIEQALDRIPRAKGYDSQGVLPREVLGVLGTLPSFPAAVAAVAAPDSIPAAITALTETAARLYLANAERHPLVMLHTVTGPSALRMMLPHISEQLQRTAFGYIWQAVAGWMAAFSAQSPLDHRDPAADGPTISEVLDRCLETGDPHAIKFVEACVREHRASAQPVYLAAAADWATRLRQAQDWTSDKKIFSGLVIRT